MSANLSIVITNYNKTQQEIEECLQSIKDQTVRPGEIIFVDDHSDISYVPEGVLYIRLPKNMGVAFARDVGVQISKSKLLLFVDADDKLGPDFIQQCGYYILKHDIIYPNMLYFGEVERNKLYPAPEKITPEYLMGKSINIPVTSMMWKKVYEKNKGFRELPVFEDWDFWLRAMANGFTFQKANTILWYRQNAKSRNRISLEVRHDVHEEMTKSFKVQRGKLVWVQNVQK